MKIKRIFSLLLSILILTTAFSVHVFAKEENTVDMDASFAKNRVIIKLANNKFTESMCEITKDSFDLDCSEIHLLNPSKSIKIQDNNEYSVADITDKQNNMFVLTLEESGKESVKSALKILNNNPAIEFAEPDYYQECTATPNDLYYSSQYALEKIDAETAWDHTKGSKNVVVGIIDTGIDGTHPDLFDNLWDNPNPNEYGYINDIHGYNFYEKYGGTPTDIGLSQGHGTHVAGIVGAKGNNEIGVSGVNWSVSLAWLGIGIEGSKSLSSSAAIEALNYANLHDIMITNSSWGGTSYSEALKTAIENYRGLFVASAGNNGTNTDNSPHYPSGYDLPNIISVANSNSSDQLSSASNYGETSVDLAAPGSGIYSTYNNSSYASLSGTSMAAPHVAGVAALIKSEYSTLTTAQIKEAILNGVDEMDNLNGVVATSGRLKAYKALQAAQTNIDVYFQNTSSWNNVKAYYWSSSGVTPVTWPGDAMTLVTDNIYKVTIPFNCDKIIFSNNGSNQTSNLTVPGNNHLYIPTANTWIDYSPDDIITLYYKNNSYWSNPKAYYWEDNGVFYPVNWPGKSMTRVKANIYKIDVPSRCDRIIFSNNGSNQTVDITISGNGKIYNPSTNAWDNYNPFTDKSISLFFTNNNNWSNVKAYLWDGTTYINNTWPGQSMTYVGLNQYSQSVYAITFDSSQYNRVIFNGSGEQTVDITSVSDGKGYYLTGEKDGNSWLVNSYNYY